MQEKVWIPRQNFPYDSIPPMITTLVSVIENERATYISVSIVQVKKKWLK